MLSLALKTEHVILISMLTTHQLLMLAVTHTLYLKQNLCLKQKTSPSKLTTPIQHSTQARMIV